jgi:hypothetical protein
LVVLKHEAHEGVAAQLVSAVRVDPLRDENNVDAGKLELLEDLE